MRSWAAPVVGHRTHAHPLVGHGACCSACAEDKPCKKPCVGAYARPVSKDEGYPKAHRSFFRVGAGNGNGSSSPSLWQLGAAVAVIAIVIRVAGGRL